MRQGLAVVLVIALALGTSGCATSTALTRAEKRRSLAQDSRILLMEPDVELYEVTAAGLLEPKADWTATARANVAAALASVFAARHVAIAADRAAADPEREHARVQLIKLHERVGATLLTFRYGPVYKLPGKGDVFDWTLGTTARLLGQETGADYALFVHFRDSYASAGRVAAIVVFAVLGVGLPEGTQVAFASLVDLETGDLVWFNRLVNPTGNLRTPEPAREAVTALLAGFPR